jgi:beta-xylosidase
VALRSKNIFGPYEQKVVLSDTTKGINFGVHQGALIRTPNNEWSTLLFVDSAPFGRCPSLHPVTWVDDWPIAGVEGTGVVRYKKPDVGKKYPIKDLPASDEFNDKTLGMQWGWNHNPDSTKWSLSRRPGFLRLETTRKVTKLPEAQNMLTQRIFASYDQTIPTIGTTGMDVRNMKDGDVAGLAVFQNPYAYIAVRQTNGSKFLVMVNNGKVIDSLAMNKTSVYLRTIASNNIKKATFEFSFDNKMFTPLGNELLMSFNLSVFTGNKFCLFNYATQETGGHVDFDWFRMKL